MPTGNVYRTRSAAFIICLFFVSGAADAPDEEATLADNACQRHVLCQWGSWRARKQAMARLNRTTECPTKAAGLAYYAWRVAESTSGTCGDTALHALRESVATRLNCSTAALPPLLPLCQNAPFMTEVSHGVLCLMIVGCAAQLATLVSGDTFKLKAG